MLTGPILPNMVISMGFAAGAVLSRGSILTLPQRALSFFSGIAAGVRSVVSRPPRFEPFSLFLNSAEEALEQIAQGKEIKIFGFGEIHARRDGMETNGITTLSKFATEILPWLVKNQGVRLLGTECFCSDMDEEIETYLESGVFDPGKTPNLLGLLTFGYTADQVGIRTFLDVVRSLRNEGFSLAVHGVFPPFSALPEPAGGPAGGAISEYITAEVLDLIERAQIDGVSSAFYNGGRHCFVGGDLRDSYVPGLRRRGCMDQFVEIQLRLPEQVYGRNVTFEDFWLVLDGVEHPVRLVGMGRNSYAMVLR